MNFCCFQVNLALVVDKVDLALGKHLHVLEGFVGEQKLLQFPNGSPSLDIQVDHFLNKLEQVL